MINDPFEGIAGEPARISTGEKRSDLRQRPRILQEEHVPAFVDAQLDAGDVRENGPLCPLSAKLAAIGWSQTAERLVAFLERRTPWDS